MPPDMPGALRRVDLALIPVIILSRNVAESLCNELMNTKANVVTDAPRTIAPSAVSKPEKIMKLFRRYYYSTSNYA